MSLNVLDFDISQVAGQYSGGIQAAIDLARAQGGGRVLVPAGTYYSLPLRLYDSIELHLEMGARLVFSDRQEDYPVVESRWEGVQTQVYQSCIYAEDAQHVAVTGFGCLDGQGQAWWDMFRNHRQDLVYPRPKLISFDRCQGVTLKDFTAINSPAWTINPIACRNITVDNVTIINPADSPNTDGIDPESCQNVRISNCHIDVGDDCIAVKSGTEDTAQRLACENITITNCTMVHGHGGVVLGSEMSGGIRNVTISNCVFQDTDRGIRLKSRRGRGGVVEDIQVSNLVMDGVICPFIMNLYYFCGPRGKEPYVWEKRPYPVTEETPTFRNIHFANITAKNVHAAAGFFYGLAENYIEGIDFNNVHIRMAERPIAGKPAMMTGMEDMAGRGMILGFCRNVTFDSCSFEGLQGPQFELDQVEGILQDGADISQES